MRITNKLMNEGAIRHMDENLQRLYAMQEKVASGKQFQRASDNPSLAAQALNLRSSIESNKAYLETTETTNSWMAATDSALQQMVKVAKRALSLSQEGLSDTQGAQELIAFGAEMEMLIEQGLDGANTTHQGNFLFAGFKTQATTANPLPYSKGSDTTGDGNYDTIDYWGDQGVILRSIGPGQTITQNVSHTDLNQPLFKPILEAMAAARNSLNSNDRASLETALADIDSALSNVTEAMTTNGARQKQVQSFGEHLETTQIDLKSLLSKKEDVNMAEAISTLRYQETVYQAVLEVGQRTISALSLFDMMS